MGHSLLMGTRGEGSHAVCTWTGRHCCTSELISQFSSRGVPGMSWGASPTHSWNTFGGANHAEAVWLHVAHAVLDWHSRAVSPSVEGYINCILTIIIPR